MHSIRLIGKISVLTFVFALVWIGLTFCGENMGYICVTS